MIPGGMLSPIALVAFRLLAAAGPEPDSPAAPGLPASRAISDSLRESLAERTPAEVRPGADSLLRSLDPGDPRRPEVERFLLYLDDLRRRTGPPAAPARAVSRFEIGAEFGRTWLGTWTDHREDAAIFGGTRSAGSKELDSAGWFRTATAAGILSFPGAGLLHRLSARTELSPGWPLPGLDWGPSTGSVEWETVGSRARSELRAATEWDGDGLVSRAGSTRISWIARSGPRWTTSVELGGGWNRYDRGGISLWEGSIGARQALSTPLARTGLALGLGWTRRTGGSSVAIPVRAAECSGVRDGERATVDGLVCHAGPGTDSVVPVPVFQGLSGLPFSPASPATWHPWSRMVQLGGSLSMIRDQRDSPWSLAVVLGGAWAGSIDRVEWTNAHLGNRKGDSLYVLRDPATGAEHLWETGAEGRYLPLVRRRERLGRLSSNLLVRPAWKFRSGSRIHLEATGWRSWSDLPRESGETGWSGWSVGCGWTLEI